MLLLLLFEHQEDNNINTSLTVDAFEGCSWGRKDMQIQWVWVRKSGTDAECKRWEERMSGKDNRQRVRERERERPKQIERTSHQYRNYVSTMQTQSKQSALFVQQITHLLATGHGIEMATFLIRGFIRFYAKCVPKDLQCLCPQCEGTIVCVHGVHTSIGCGLQLLSKNSNPST